MDPLDNAHNPAGRGAIISHNYIVEPFLLVKLQGHYFHNGPVSFPGKTDRAVKLLMALLLFPGKLANRAIMKISTSIMVLLD